MNETLYEFYAKIVTDAFNILYIW